MPFGVSITAPMRIRLGPPGAPDAEAKVPIHPRIETRRGGERIRQISGSAGRTTELGESERSAWLGTVLATRLSDAPTCSTCRGPGGSMARRSRPCSARLASRPPPAWLARLRGDAEGRIGVVLPLAGGSQPLPPMAPAPPARPFRPTLTTHMASWGARPAPRRHGWRWRRAW